MPFADELRFARMSGSTIAAPGAAGWVTDFLNAAYFARPADARTLDDLCLAHGVLTTRWQRLGRRLGARDLVAFHRAFGPQRLRAWPPATLTREGLEAGAAALLGDWFGAAWADDARRAHGVAFPTVEEREAFDPSVRLADAALGTLSPPVAPPVERHWATYAPVPLPAPDRALALLADPARWPDVAAEAGRFTALRPGGLEGQTFEIEVLAGGAVRAPVATRGYVTATRLETEAGAVRAFAAALDPHLDEPALPAGSEPLLALELTTHEGHFLGRARSNLLVWRGADGVAAIRDVGCWDPLPLHLAAPYAAVGRAAQHAFWGPERPDRSMLVQLALRTAA